MRELRADVLVLGGGLGGVAASWAAAQAGVRVALSEGPRWLGGQLTAHAVPPDQHPWVEQLGVTAAYVVDATETGELLPLAGVEYVTGFEPQDEPGEPSASAIGDPLNMQAGSWCFAVDDVDGDHTIARPASYYHWRATRPNVWPGTLLAFSWPESRTPGWSQASVRPSACSPRTASARRGRRTASMKSPICSRHSSHCFSGAESKGRCSRTRTLSHRVAASTAHFA